MLLYLDKNSFNPWAAVANKLTINYSITTIQEVKITIYAVSGRVVRTFKTTPTIPGYVYQLQWDGKADDNQLVASGLYLIHISTNGYHETKKVIVLKW